MRSDRPALVDSEQLRVAGAGCFASLAGRKPNVKKRILEEVGFARKRARARSQNRMARTGKWFAAALADAILSSYGTNGRRPVGALPEDLYTVTNEDYIAATTLQQRPLSDVPARDLAPGEKVQRMLNKVCRSLGSTTFPTRAKRAFVLQDTGVMLSRMEVVRGTPRAQAGSAVQIAAYATKNLLRSLNVTDATFPTRFVVEFVQLMHDCGYRQSYVASPEFEYVLLKHLRSALNPQGRDSSAPYRQIRSELAASKDVAQPIRVACLVGGAGTRLPRCHAS